MFAVLADGDDRPARAGVVGRRPDGAGALDHLDVSRVQRQHRPARVEAGVDAYAQSRGIGVADRPGRAVRRARQGPHRFEYDRLAVGVTVPQRRVHVAGVAAAIGSPGDEQRRQPRGVELVHRRRTRGTEVHEREAVVRLGDPILEAGGDPEVVDLDPQGQFGHGQRLDRDRPEGAQCAQDCDHDRARTAEPDGPGDRRLPRDRGRLVRGSCVLGCEPRDGRRDELGRRLDRRARCRNVARSASRNVSRNACRGVGAPYPRGRLSRG